MILKVGLVGSSEAASRTLVEGERGRRSSRGWVSAHFDFILISLTIIIYNTSFIASEKARERDSTFYNYTKNDKIISFSRWRVRKASWDN